MCETNRKDFYMRWLYRIAYKFYLFNPWTENRYFDFYYMEYSTGGRNIRYVLNFESYNVVPEPNAGFEKKTIWIHVYEENGKKLNRMKAYCCVFSIFGDIPELYRKEVEKWKKQPFSSDAVPFFVDFTGERPCTLDFEASRDMYYLLNNSYCVLMTKKCPAKT